MIVADFRFISMEEMIHGLHRASPGWKKKKISRYIHYPVAVTAHVSAASIKKHKKRS